jgi:ferredoxin
MASRADPNLLQDLKKFGGVNIESCFNCGNCTAICPLSSDGESFPRKMIRYAQLGLRDRLLGSKELWMCYACGECTETCPRQAAPGDFMSAARRYAIASYDFTGLAKLLLGSPIWSLLSMLGLAGIIALFLFSGHGSMALDSLRLFEFISAELIHDLGVRVIAMVFVSGLTGAVNMVRRVSKANGYTPGTRLNWLGALWDAIGIEALGQRRYRQDRGRRSLPQLRGGPKVRRSNPQAIQPKWYMRKWFLHASMLWGFLGLLGATVLDYSLDLLGLKPTGTPVPIWFSVRLLGSLAGLLLAYGVTVVLWRRARKEDASVRTSNFSDWSFLAMMWIAAVSGFLIEISLYLPQPPIWGYWMLLVHVVLAMELVLLAPFTKFAHVLYRTIALYLAALKPLPEAVPIPVEVIR